MHDFGENGVGAQRLFGAQVTPDEFFERRIGVTEAAQQACSRWPRRASQQDLEFAPLQGPRRSRRDRAPTSAASSTISCEPLATARLNLPSSAVSRFPQAAVSSLAWGNVSPSSSDEVSI